MRAADVTALVLVIIGGLNWGLVGAFDFNLVASIFGEESFLSRLVYILVGLSALWCLLSVVPKLTSDRGRSLTHPTV